MLPIDQITSIAISNEPFGFAASKCISERLSDETWNPLEGTQDVLDVEPDQLLIDLIEFGGWWCVVIRR